MQIDICNSRMYCLVSSRVSLAAGPSFRRDISIPPLELALKVKVIELGHIGVGSRQTNHII